MSDHQVIPGVGTSAAPSCTNAINSLWLAWKGEGIDPQIYFTRSAIPEIGGTGPVPYLPQARVNGAVSSDGPSITHFDSTVYLAWKDLGSGVIFWSFWSEATKSWALPTELILEGGYKPQTSSAPAIVGVASQLYICWRDQATNRLGWSTWSPATKIWSPALFLPVGFTDAAPALASEGTAVFMAWKNAGDNFIFWCSAITGVAVWSVPLIVATTGTTTGPSLAVVAGTVWLAWQGFQFQNLYYTSLVNAATNQWTAQTPVVGLATGSTPSLAVTTGDSSGIIFACKGTGTDTGIYYGPLRLPPRNYIFILPSFEIKNMRSGTYLGKTSSDTDYVCLAVKVGSAPPQIVTQFVGDQTGGVVPSQLSIAAQVQDSDLVSMHYTIVNSSQGQQTVQFLSDAAASFLHATEKADEAAIKAYFGVDLSSINSTEAAILLGAQIGTETIPVFGSVLGAIAGWLVSIAPWGSLWPDCDGPVASGLHVFTGWNLRLLSNTPNGLNPQIEDNPGVNSPSGCGSNSDYKVTWWVLPNPNDPAS